MSDANHSTAGHDHSDDGPYGAEEVHAHIGSYKQYAAIFVALVFLTILTSAVAGIHLGKANLAVAVVIASIKASLVCTFFMHLKDDNKFYTLILLAAITFIGIFFALTLNDTTYREQLDKQSGNRTYLPSGDPAPGSWENPIKLEEKKEGEGAGPGASAAPGTSAAPSVGASAAPEGASGAPATSEAPSASAAPPPASAAPMPTVTTALAASTAAPAHSSAPAHSGAPAHPAHSAAPAPTTTQAHPSTTAAPF